MAVDLSPIDADLLKTLTDVHGIPAGAYNIRKDGELLSRSNSANIEIATKTDNPGIDIFIKEGTKGEKVYIPVILSKAGLTDVVYNTFHIADNCDVTSSLAAASITMRTRKLSTMASTRSRSVRIRA